VLGGCSGPRDDDPERSAQRFALLFSIQNKQQKGILMKTVLRMLLLLLAFSAAIDPAQAAWTTPSAVNATTLNGEPSCVGLGNGEALCGALGSKSTVIASRYNGTSWSAWKALSGAASSAPSCVDNGAGRVVCASRATSGQLQYAVYDPAVNIWSTTQKVTSTLFSGPSCARLGTSNVLCAARSSSGGLIYSVYDGVAWSAFSTVTGSILSRPACASDGSGGVVCVVINPANGLSAIRYASGAWGAFTPLGGVAGSDDVRCNAVEGSATYKVFCLVAGANSVVYLSYYTGKAWSGWGSLGLQTNYGASCGQYVSGQVVCGAVAVSDNALYTTTWNGTSWAAWAKLGGTGRGTPACAGLGNGKVMCAFPGVDNKLIFAAGP
jgi:hypothetical protein